jgi:hypothetical protein
MEHSSAPDGAAAKRERIATYGAGGLSVCGLLLLLVLMLSLGLRRGMNHDECLPLAGGAVFARHSLLPYRDYPYFHMPDLVLIYGVLFRCCRYVLLSARVFSVVSGWLTILLLWCMARRECRGKPIAVRWLLPAAAALLVFSCPVFREAFWRTWNHASATLFGLVAAAFALRPRGRWRWFWSGVFVGLATGTRLTFAPMFAPLAVAAALDPAGGEMRERVRRVAVYFAGGTISMLPSLILLAMAPAQFLYGNFVFNSTTNILFRQSYHDPQATLRVRLLYPFVSLLPNRSNLLLFVIFVLVVAWALVRFAKMPADARYRLLLALGLIPFAYLGAISPQVTQQEYYYPFVPLLVLPIAIAAAALCAGRAGWILAVLLFAASILPTAWTWHEYQRLAILRKPSEWPAMVFHEAGLEASQWVRAGPVLTLEPILPIEAGRDIYPALVTGGIAWRAEPFVPTAQRDSLIMVGPDNFAPMLARTPPGAIFTTATSQLEGPMIAWAKSHGYTPHLLRPKEKIVDATTVWVPAQ